MFSVCFIFLVFSVGVTARPFRLRSLATNSLANQPRSVLITSATVNLNSYELVQFLHKHLSDFWSLGPYSVNVWLNQCCYPSTCLPLPMLLDRLFVVVIIVIVIVCCHLCFSICHGYVIAANANELPLAKESV